MLVFNFHHVEPESLTRRLDPDRKHITITPQGLRGCIRTLRALGMEIVSLRDVLQADEPVQDSSRKVILTFDDGYVNNAEYAVPVLEAERCPATIFVLPGRFGGTNVWDQGDLPEAERDALMTLEQMQAVGRSNYVTFGSHGMLHRDFATLDDADLAWEIQESHRILGTELAEAYLPVLAYPWGHYSERVVRAMEDSPYQYAFTVETGPWQPDAPRFEVPRYSAYYRDGNPMIFIAKLCRHKLLFR